MFTHLLPTFLLFSVHCVDHNFDTELIHVYDSDNKRNYGNSQQYCQQNFINGTLASVTSQIIQQRIETLHSNSPGSSVTFWIGLRYNNKNCTICNGTNSCIGDIKYWDWISDSNSNYTNWYTQDPRCCNCGKDCVAIRSDLSYEWVDRSCNETFKSFICQRIITNHPTMSPSMSETPTKSPSIVQHVIYRVGFHIGDGGAHSNDGDGQFTLCIYGNHSLWSEIIAIGPGTFTSSSKWYYFNITSFYVGYPIILQLMTDNCENNVRFQDSSVEIIGVSNSFKNYYKVNYQSIVTDSDCAILTVDYIQQTQNVNNYPSHCIHTKSPTNSPTEIPTKTTINPTKQPTLTQPTKSPITQIVTYRITITICDVIGCENDGNGVYSICVYGNKALYSQAITVTNTFTQRGGSYYFNITTENVGYPIGLQIQTDDSQNRVWIDSTTVEVIGSEISVSYTPGIADDLETTGDCQTLTIDYETQSSNVVENFGNCVHTASPTNQPTVTPTEYPSNDPSNIPSITPTGNPTKYPSRLPSFNPTQFPSSFPTTDPTSIPTRFPSDIPTFQPSINPTNFPSSDPSDVPSNNPQNNPSSSPTVNPTVNPTNIPSNNPSSNPSNYPSIHPSFNPTVNPSNIPSFNPSFVPTFVPTINPTKYPTFLPTMNKTNNPSIYPSFNPSKLPSKNPTNTPTNIPSFAPTIIPTLSPITISNASKSTTNSTIIVITSLSSVIVVLSIILLYFYYTRFYKKKKKTEENDIQLGRIHTLAGIAEELAEESVDKGNNEIFLPGSNNNSITTRGSNVSSEPKSKPKRSSIKPLLRNSTDFGDKFDGDNIPQELLSDDEDLYDKKNENENSLDIIPEDVLTHTVTDVGKTEVNTGEMEGLEKDLNENETMIEGLDDNVLNNESESSSEEIIAEDGVSTKGGPNQND